VHHVSLKFHSKHEHSISSATSVSSKITPDSVITVINDTVNDTTILSQHQASIHTNVHYTYRVPPLLSFTNLRTF